METPTRQNGNFGNCVMVRLIEQAFKLLPIEVTVGNYGGNWLVKRLIYKGGAR